MNPPARKARLGKGLGALLGDYVDVAEPGGEAQRLKVSAIRPNPKQPRRAFSPTELDELAQSIDQNGLLQPLLVRPAPGQANKYELVAGERRLRAVRKLGWKDVPAVTREVPDDVLLVLALVENLQREALSPMEEAEGYEVLVTQHGLSHSAIARSVGKGRSTVANMLRLLQLPPSVRRLVDSGELSAGHARALLTIDDSGHLIELARRTVKEGWSVREVEEEARTQRPKTKKGRTRASTARRDPALRVLEEELRAVLATKVGVKSGKKGAGVIEIPFHNSEDLERVFQLITGREATEVVS